jgi:glycosyltransferase involved in cell wall biosynthesis
MVAWAFSLLAYASINEAMNKPLTLSLVIPVYNEERHLKACLEAIKRQSVRPFEVIVVDNNSTDASMTIAAHYRFVTVVKEKKQGIVFARNAGFNAAHGDIIGRIDADSIIPPHWAERVLKFYENPAHHNEALTGGGYFYNIRTRRFNSWLLSQLAFRMNRFIVGFYILWGSNMAFPRVQWQKVRSSVCHDDFIHEDLDLAIHLHQLGYKITYSARLRVGVYLKRVWENREQQNKHLMRWPKTLKKHHYRRWWLSISGNILLKYVIQPYVVIAEGIGRLLGRKKRIPGS